MMRRQGFRWVTARAFAALTVLTAVGCGSSPEPIYYALTPSRDSRPAGGGASWAHLIKLRRPAIAGYLDRAEIVTRVSDHRLRVASGESWGAPLADMTGRVFVEDLSARLNGCVVFTELSPISAAPDAVVSLDIQRFDVGDDGMLNLRAEVSVERGTDHAVVGVRTVDLHLRPASASTTALVAAMSDLVAQLADQVVPYLVATPGGDAAPRPLAQLLQSVAP